MCLSIIDFIVPILSELTLQHPPIYLAPKSIQSVIYPLLNQAESLTSGTYLFYILKSHNSLQI